MKIMLTIDFPPEIGGIQQYLYDITTHLFDENDYVIAGTSPSLKKKSPKLLCNLITVTTPISNFNKKWSLIPLFFAFLAIVIQNKKVTIESGNIYAAIPAFILNLFFKQFPYSVYCYGKELLPLQKKTFKTLFLKLVLNRAHKKYVLTEFTIQLLRQAGIRGECIITPPRIEFSKFNISITRPKNNFLNLLSVGRLVVHKGHALLIEAVSLIPSSVIWHLTIVGMGPEYKRLNTLISNFSLTQNIVIKPNLNSKQIKDEYNSADIFIFPSLDIPDGVEGFGIVLLEAMALQVPIIASNTGGIPEVLGNNCGILTPSGNPQALCDAIIQLHNNSQLCEVFRKNGVKRVKECFSWN